MHNKSLFSIISLIVLSAAIVGCDVQDDADQGNDTEEALSDLDHVFRLGTPEAAEQDQTQEMSHEVLQQFSTYTEAAKEASTLVKADQSLQDVLSDSSSVPRYMQEQLAALAMFIHQIGEGGFAEKKLTDDEVRVVGRYTEYLVENRSPEADFVLRGLERLRGHWSDEQIVEAAEVAAESARSTYVDSDRPDLEITSQAEKEFTGSVQSHEDEALEAAQRLDQLPKEIN